MKFNRSMLGGTIRKSNFEPYARYFQKFLDAYKAEGLEIQANPSPQNGIFHLEVAVFF
jgi:O-glycosyl hydrolase